MRAASRLLSLILLLAIACSRESDDRAAARPSPAPPPATSAPSASSAQTAEPVAAVSPDTDGNDEDNANDGFVAADGRFQLAVKVSQYFGPVPMTVNFAVRARNGTPPYTYVWEFGDGAPFETGESVTHTYTDLGRIFAFVHGRDTEGAQYTIQIVMFATTPEEYARQKGPLPVTSSTAPDGDAPPTPAP